MQRDLTILLDIVDLEEVWKTATVDVPDLLAVLEPLVPPQE